MKKEQILEIATPIIVSGFEAGQDHNVIKGALVSAGIPFGQANSVFKEIAISENLMRDPADIRDEVEAQVLESDWESVADWSQVMSIVDEIKTEVQGSTDAQVLSRIRSYAKDEGIDLPKKTTKKAGSKKSGGKILTAVVDLFNEIQKPSKLDFCEALRPHVKATKNELAWLNHHYLLAYAIGNSMSVVDAIAETKDMELPIDSAKETPESDE